MFTVPETVAPLFGEVIATPVAPLASASDVASMPQLKERRTESFRNLTARSFIVPPLRAQPFQI